MASFAYGQAPPPPESTIVADLNAVAENMRLRRDGGFKPPVTKPNVWPYDPQTGSTFSHQRVDSRFPNPPSSFRPTALRRKAEKQYLSAEAAKRHVPTWVASRTGGIMPLPGPSSYTVQGTFGRPLESARMRTGERFVFSTVPRFDGRETALG